MQTLIKIFLLGAALSVAAVVANYYGLVSIPWLDFNTVPTYSEDALRTDQTLKEASGN